MIGVIVIAIVYYDGDCGYCNRAVMWLIHHKISTRFQFAQLESSYGDHLIDVRPDLQKIDSIIVVDGDKVLIKSSAIIHLLYQIKRLSTIGVGFEMDTEMCSRCWLRCICQNQT
ncbi:DUF393 domain-containing protein [Mammaliicoccus sciuri]|nr:DUF393 domain-containing protein [Mammaliicoccus sciuri]